MFRQASKATAITTAAMLFAMFSPLSPLPAQDAPKPAPNPSSNPSPSPSSDQSAQQSSFVLKVNAELVLTNVVARDTKTGELVRGLKQSDFTVFENGKRQQIA